MFYPVFHITTEIAKHLMAIEADRQFMADLPEAADIALPSREQPALDHQPLTPEDLQSLHGALLTNQLQPLPYRQNQNVILDGPTGVIVYMPPEASDVPALMSELLAWINDQQTNSALPAPLVAALAHYQYVTIRPHDGGNGRAGRLLAALILRRASYDAIAHNSLDDYAARHRPALDAALSAGPSPNYYIGRAQADITAFLALFIAGMAEASHTARLLRASAASAAKPTEPPDLPAPVPPALRLLPPRERKLLDLLDRRGIATAADIATHLGLEPRTIVGLCPQWIAQGLLEIHNPSRKSRSYRRGQSFGG